MTTTLSFGDRRILLDPLCARDPRIPPIRMGIKIHFTIGGASLDLDPDVTLGPQKAPLSTIPLREPSKWGEALLLAHGGSASTIRTPILAPLSPPGPCNFTVGFLSLFCDILLTILFSSEGCIHNQCQNGTCTATGWGAGNYTCQCKSGWTGNLCDAWVNPCVIGGSNCSPGVSLCTNTGPGQASCACYPGYTGNGLTCDGLPSFLVLFGYSETCLSLDINECSNATLCAASDPNVNCTNTPGSYTCYCIPGYVGNPTLVGGCTACAAGKYQSGVSCQSCPPLMTSDPGTVNIAGCRCQAGYAFNSTSQSCSQLFCQSDVSFGAQWSSVAAMQASNGTCLPSYYVYSGSFPTDLIKPQRRCDVSKNQTSAQWDDPIIPCYCWSPFFIFFLPSPISLLFSVMSGIPLPKWWHLPAIHVLPMSPELHGEILRGSWPPDLF